MIIYIKFQQLLTNRAVPNGGTLLRYDSNFSKSLLSALASLSPQQLQHPITIEAQAADSDEVLFCRVGAVLDLLLIFLKGSRSEPFKKINNRFETLPAASMPTVNIFLHRGMKELTGKLLLNGRSPMLT
jgi:hypothetical protein